METADKIWNRAATSNGGTAPRMGDAALSSVLDLHNLAMSGGLVDAVERLTAEQLEAAQAGNRWLRLEPAAEVIATVRREIEAGALETTPGRKRWSHERIASTAKRYPPIRRSLTRSGIVFPRKQRRLPALVVHPLIG